MRQRRSNGYLQDTDRQEEEEMKYITFDEDKPYDLILLGRVAIDFNPLDYNKPLYESETFKKYVGGSPANIAVGMARLGKKIGFFAKVSDDQFGTFVERYFENEGIDISHISRCQNGEKLGLTFIEEYFAAVGENNYKSLLLRQYMVMDIFYCVQEFLKGINVNTDDIPPERKDIKLIPKAIINVETTLMYLTDLFIFALTMRDRASNDRYGTLIRDAKDYIAQNYSNSDFSLNMIATHIGVSPSYFSSIFKQETGQSFVEYLTKSRIDKACGLLKCTTLRTAEIGERVGYNDPHYFSSTFKKITGQSPKEFKAKEVKNES